MPRGISLFRYISPNRSCEDARIEAHWCSCLNWIDVNILSPDVQNTTNSSYQTDYDDPDTSNALSSSELLTEPVLDDDLKTNSSNSSAVVAHGKAGKVLVKKQLNYTQYQEIRKSLRRFSPSALKVAQKAVDYMNSLIDDDLKRECERIRLQSIEKISKLDLNRKLLAFKESKDIHGREAVFDDETSYQPAKANLTNSNVIPSAIAGSKMAGGSGVYDELENDLRIADTHYDRTTTPQADNSTPTDTNRLTDAVNDDQPVNLMLASNQTKQGLVAELENVATANSTKNMPTIQNTDIVFQIVLTTWPGEASYELSLKYNKYSGLFQFNKNEISRINSYNTTSNCMIDKRPDLRQFCYCRYQ